jgi:arsenate reductase (thioredoxin)
MSSKTKVLFLCTGNSARSQMAEAFLRKYASDHFESLSAGLEPKGINPYTIKVMSEIGIDISNQTSKSVSEYLGKVLIQVLITVCDNAEKNCPSTWPGINKRLHWSFEDPAALAGSEEEKLQKFREVRNQMDVKIQSWLTEQGIEISK